MLEALEALYVATVVTTTAIAVDHALDQADDKPVPVSLDLTDTDTNTDTDDDDYITLYRGVSTENEGQHKLAMAGIAVPHGVDMLGNVLSGAQTNPEEHSYGDNFSIFTSWSRSEGVAKKFSKGEKGDRTGGVLLTKRFRRDELVYLLGAVPSEQEVLVMGIVRGAHSRIVD